MKTRGFVFVVASLIASVAPATPSVGNVTMSQDAASGEVTIGYELTGSPAVVTVDIQTNGVSIGGKYLMRMSGDYSKLVTVDGHHEIVWLPDLPWADAADTAAFNLRAEVLAAAADDLPDILVADLRFKNEVSYYANVESLPGGLWENPEYRTTKLVIKRVRAKNVTWTRGSSQEPGAAGSTNFKCEEAHEVTLDKDYYLGLFEFTQAQLQTLGLTTAHAFPGAMRPCDKIAYTFLRGSDTKYYWPADPDPNSILGKLRAQTGLKFDMPSESQWEFAARGGVGENHGDGFWGDGTPITSTGTCPNLTAQARCKANAYVTNEDGSETALGTADVGSYPPNSLGFYDMAGNVRERCLDFWQGANDYSGAITPSNGKNVTALAGAVNVYQGELVGDNRGKYIHEVCNKEGYPNGADSGTYYHVGDLFPGGDRVWRGGCWDDNASNCRPRVRNGWSAGGITTGSNLNGDIGFRVALTIE